MLFLQPMKSLNNERRRSEKIDISNRFKDTVALKVTESVQSGGNNRQSLKWIEIG